MATTIALENITEAFTENPFVYDLPYYLWSIYESCSVTLIAISLYIFFAVLRFTIVKSEAVSKRRQDLSLPDPEMGPKKSAKGSFSELSIHRSTSTRSRRSRTGQSAESLRLLCLFASLFAVFRIGADQLELGTYWSERINCKIYQVN